MAKTFNNRHTPYVQITTISLNGVNFLCWSQIKVHIIYNKLCNMAMVYELNYTTINIYYLGYCLYT